jgi:methyl-accepting chemotaxis protein
MTTTVATGIAKQKESSEAAKQAVEAALRKLDGKKPDLAMVYCGTAYDYETVVSTVRSLTENAPLIGCSTGGEFTEEEVGSGNVAVGLVASDSMVFHTAMAVGLAEDELATMKKVVDQLPGDIEGYPHRAGLLVVDGLRGKGAEATISAANLLTLEVPLVGGAAGDDLEFQETSVFCNDEVATNSAAICLISSKNQFFTGVEHGHMPLSEELEVTRAEGSTLFEVNGRPAWDVWKEEAGRDAKRKGIDVESLSEAGEIGSFLVQYELGLTTDEGKYKVRVPLAKNEDGSLGFACTVPQGASFRIMKSEQQKQIDSARKAMEQAKQQAGDTPIAGALVFDCVCRGLILEERFSEAVEEFKKVLGPNVPILGWETYGEVCMHPGEFSGFHNTTSVVMLLP